MTIAVLPVGIVIVPFWIEYLFNIFAYTIFLDYWISCALAMLLVGFQSTQFVHIHVQGFLFRVPLYSGLEMR